MKTAFLDYLNFNMKLVTILIVGILTTLKQFVFEFVIDDVKFLISFGLLFSTYTLTGSVKALVKGEFRLPLLIEKTMLKVISYVLFIGGVSVLVKLKVGNKPNEWVSWLDDYLFIAAAVNLFFHTIKNLIVINPSLVGPKVAKWFEDSAESGTITKPNP